MPLEIFKSIVSLGDQNDITGEKNLRRRVNRWFTDHPAFILVSMKPVITFCGHNQAMVHFFVYYERRNEKTSGFQLMEDEADFAERIHPASFQEGTQAHRLATALAGTCDELALSQRALHSLSGHFHPSDKPIETLLELIQLTEAQILERRRTGFKTLKELKNALGEMGLRFGMTQLEILILLERDS